MPEAPEEALHHAVHRAQQDAALAVDVAAVLALQRGAYQTYRSVMKVALHGNNEGGNWPCES